MTDSELLEKAAKAAGIFLTPETLKAIYPKWEWSDTDEPVHLDGGGMLGTVVVYSYSGELSGTTRQEWHPLTDDGDALRLAGILYLVVAVMKATHDKPAFTSVYHFNGPEHVSEPHGDDANAATRRAIVRAAAAIGETL